MFSGVLISKYAVFLTCVPFYISVSLGFFAAGADQFVWFLCGSLHGLASCLNALLLSSKF